MIGTRLTRSHRVRELVRTRVATHLGSSVVPDIAVLITADLWIRIIPGHRTAMRGAEGINPEDWTPRELRHSFVSLLSENGLPPDEIARLVGHSNSAVTE